ncbi:MAG: hypothetical protein PHU25_14810 [Deltaproteobacteria bacterium]|nr:hypothetical protein [Deltaproteobacteria bacterium]
MKPTLFITTLVLTIAAACSGEGRWEGKDAWRRCDEAITNWPGTPAPPCAAMHICANEAPLSPGARGKLTRMIAATPECPEP